MTCNDDFSRLLCLFEDYTLQRCGADGGPQQLFPAIVPSLVFALGEKHARVIRIAPRNDGHILAELCKFERVYLSAGMPSETQDEVAYNFYRRGKNWVVCAPSAISERRQSGMPCITDFWNTPSEEFAALLWALMRWSLKSGDFEQIIFAVSTPAHRHQVQAALPILAQQKSVALLAAAQVLLRPESLRAFALLDDPQRPPEEGEIVLLLYLEEQRAERCEWHQGEFRCQYLPADQEVNLRRVSRFAVCTGTLETAPADIVLFRSPSELYDHALAHYVMWYPVLQTWALERQRQYLQILQENVKKLEYDNQKLAQLIQRAGQIFTQVNALPVKVR